MALGWACPESYALGVDRWSCVDRTKGSETSEFAIAHRTFDLPVCWLANRRLAVIALFVFNAVLLYPAFLPSLNQINLWDQARDIDRGRKLVEGVLPAFATNPAVAGLYAFTYLPFARSPEWLVYTDSLARFLLFVLSWVASFAVARKLAPLATPLVMMAFVAISPVVVQLLANGSDALFASLSGLALWQFLSFRAAHRDMGVESMRTGSVALRTAQRSYTAFEQGHGIAFASSVRGL